MNREDVINEAIKALKDIGHWENFIFIKAHRKAKSSLFEYNHWYVRFQHTVDDYKKGIVSPLIVVNEEEELVTFVNWERSEFLLSYCESENKYSHPRLNREQPDLD